MKKFEDVSLKVGPEAEVKLQVKDFDGVIKAKVIGAINTANFPFGWINIDSDITAWYDENLFTAVKAWRENRPANS